MTAPVLGAVEHFIPLGPLPAVLERVYTSKCQHETIDHGGFFFWSLNFYSATRTTWHRGGHVISYVICSGVTIDHVESGRLTCNT
jgi:hypothetical protein